MNHLSFHTDTWKWIGSLVIFSCEAGFHRALLSDLNADPDVNPTVIQSQSEELWLNTFRPAVCFSTVWMIIEPSCCRYSSDKSRGSDFLVDISVFMSRVCFDVCLMQVDAIWKTKRKVLFCCKYNLFSSGCPGPFLPSCDWTKVKSSRSLFRHSGRVPHSRFTAVTVEVKGKVWLRAVGTFHTRLIQVQRR